LFKEVNFQSAIDKQALLWYSIDMKERVSMKVTKKQITAFIKTKLATNDAWALRALTIVAQNQTLIEQNALTTIERNGVGFTAFDAQILQSFNDQYQQRGGLSQKQMTLVHTMIPKYHNQVVQSSKDQGKYEELIKLVIG